MPRAHPQTDALTVTLPSVIKASFKSPPMDVWTKLVLPWGPVVTAAKLIVAFYLLRKLLQAISKTLTNSM